MEKKLGVIFATSVLIAVLGISMASRKVDAQTSRLVDSALAELLTSGIFPPPVFPPPVQFTNNGTMFGTVQTQGITLPITGKLDYLVAGGVTNVLVDTGGQQTNSLVTPTVIKEWEFASTDPTTCREEVLSGDSLPQCTAWNNPAPNQWSRDCTVTVQGNKATFHISFTLSGNLVISFVVISQGENDNSQGNEGMTGSIAKITVASQGSFPPDLSVFDLPSICPP